MLENVSLTVADGTEMLCKTARPEGNGPFPGLIVMQEAFGVNAHFEALTQRFAAAGFLTVTPELYHRTAPKGFTVPYNNFQTAAPHFSAVTEQTITEDSQACFDWLTQKGGCKSVAAIGYCMGGRAAFIANSALLLKAAVSYYGGRIVPTNLELATKQKSPILFFWGGLDKHIPAEQIETLNRALVAAEKPFTCVQISDADHGFFCEDRPVYNEMAAKTSWAHTLAYLEARMR